MKRITLTLAVAATALALNAAEPVPTQSTISNGWELGINAGAITQMHNGAFFGQMRPTIGINAGKAVSPAFTLGVEAFWGINTSTWRGAAHSYTAFDNSYIGAFGNIDFMGLFGGPVCQPRKFTTALSLGAGWGHNYMNGNGDWNYFATKVGLLFNFNVSNHVTIKVQPSILWNMTDNNIEQTSCGYDVHRAAFHLQAGVTYRFGEAAPCVTPFDQAQIDGLNGQINDLRARLGNADAAAAAAAAEAARLKAELDACKARPVVREVQVDNRLNTVCDVFFTIGSSTITKDQMPNVERIAAYMKSHPEATVSIKGYASKDGNLEFNQKLAARRAEAVKESLIKRFKIAANRIQAEGQGIGEMFEEESWNRVSICTLENKQ